MCYLCFGTSVLTILTPGPQPADLAPVGVPSVVYNQVNATDTPTAIGTMLNRLPNSPELSLLRSELKSLQARLGTAKNNAEADKILKTGLQAIDQRLAAEPNSEKIAEALLDAIATSGDEQSAKSLKKMMKPTNYSGIHLKGQSNRGGWLP